MSTPKPVPGQTVKVRRPSMTPSNGDTVPQGTLGVIGALVVHDTD